MAYPPFPAAVPDGLLYDTDRDIWRCELPDARLEIHFSGLAGATAFVARTLDPAWRALVY